MKMAVYMQWSLKFSFMNNKRHIVSRTLAYIVINAEGRRDQMNKVTIMSRFMQSLLNSNKHKRHSSSIEQNII